MPASTRFIYDESLAYPPRFLIKKLWEDDWIPAPYLRLIQAELATAAHGESRLEVVADYGDISEAWESDFTPLESFDLRGWWIRMDLVSPDGCSTEWVGKIFPETRLIEGTDHVRSGQQTWTAFGPQAILDRISIYQSWWHGAEVGGSQGEPILLDWMPSINRLDERGVLWGNRCENAVDDVYLYGNQKDWLHRQFCDYLLAKFVDESEDDGPAWKLVGQTDILDDLETVVELQAIETVGALLRKLISPRYGVDYLIRLTKDPTTGEDIGFELDVFCLLGDEVIFDGEILPKNPNTVQYIAGAARWEKRTTIEATDLDHYHTIKVIGRRTVICCSLIGENCPIAGAGEHEGLWDAGLQTEYEAAGGPGSNLTPEEHDQIRQSPRYETVFQTFGAKLLWGNREEFSTLTVGGCDDTGEFQVTGFATESPYQNAVRKTLSWLPLRKNMDYSVAPATEWEVNGRSSELLAPCVWLCTGTYFGAAPKYSRADQIGIGVSALSQDWGVQLHSTPNHLIAASVANLTQPTKVLPRYYPEFMAITIAFECDQRPVATAYDDEDKEDRPSKGVLVIDAPEIEHWILSPNTVVGVDANGHLQGSGSGVRILRDDHQKMAAIMAGAISRHQRQRARAEITAEGLIPWSGLLGVILSTIEEAGDTQEIQAALTSITWSATDAGEQSTVIRTGFARSEYQA